MAASLSALPGGTLAGVAEIPLIDHSRPTCPTTTLPVMLLLLTVVEREHPCRGISHQQIGGVGTVEAADTGHLQRRTDRAERAVEQDRYLADGIELVGAIGIALHHQRGGGARGRRRFRWQRHRKGIAPLAAVVGAI